MARSLNNVQKYCTTKCESINPLADPVTESMYELFLELNKVEEVWNDSVSDSFRHEVTEHTKETSKEYVIAIIQLYERYLQILEQAKQLTNTTAGFGGWLSFLDLQVIAERGVSRLFFNRDDQRL